MQHDESDVSGNPLLALAVRQCYHPNMRIYNLILSDADRLDKEIKFYKSQLKSLPEGNLCTNNTKFGISYFHQKGKSKTYIPVKEKSLIFDLARKTYFKHLLSDAENELAACEAYLKHYKKPSLEDYLVKHRSIVKLLSNQGIIGPIKNAAFDSPSIESLNPDSFVSRFFDQAWLNKLSQSTVLYKLFRDHATYNADGSVSWNYEGSVSAPYQEKRSVKTLCGINVRSKSESFIADALYNNNILFLYEPEFFIGSQKIFPDFLIFHPIHGYAVIHEHGGMLLDYSRNAEYTDEEYQAAMKYTNNFSYKIRDYIQNGWYLGINLIITSETKFRPFSSSDYTNLVNSILFDGRKGSV